MIPQDAAPESDAQERDALRTDLRNSLGVITGRTQILRQQVLRADGLLNLEREQLLTGIVALLAEAERMNSRLEALIGDDQPDTDTPAGPLTVTTRPPN